MGDRSDRRLKDRSLTVSELPLAQFTFVDLFAGIGGFHLALDALGGTCVFASDIDPECQAVYRKRWTDMRFVADIREITTNKCRDVPPHDVLCAGFPCQPFSKSGAQLGLRDRTRGTLFFEIMEIVRARHPRYLILENVRNITGPRHLDTWQTIIDSLREENYRVADEPTILSPHMLPPEHDGRPQVRERVFILAEHVGASGDVFGPRLITSRPVPSWDPRLWSIEDFLQRDDEIARLADYKLRPIEEQWLQAWDEFVQVIDDDQLPGFPIWVDAFRKRPTIPLGTPTWKADFLRKNADFYSRHKSKIDPWIKRHRVDRFPPSRRKFEWQARGQPRSIWNLLIHLRPSGIRVRPPTYVPALVAITQTSIFGPRRRRLTPREAARLQGFPDDFELHPSMKVAYRQLGNAVNVGAVKYAAHALLNSSAASLPRQMLLVS